MQNSDTNLKSRRPFLSLLLVAAIFLPTSAALAAIHDVMVGNNFFRTANGTSDLTIEVGDTVRWTNSAGRSHDVTADDGSFASVTAASFTFQRTFMSVEEILYHCTVHSRAANQGGTSMNGRIVVVAASVSAEIAVDSVDAVDGSYQVGDTVDITASLTNSGAGDSGMFSVTFNASADSMNPVELGTVAVSNIAAGTSMNVNASFVLPVGMTTGYWTIDAESDHADGNSADDSNADATPIFVFTEFTINAGLNDAWFNKATDGQGFFVTVFPELNVILIAWFTYDTVLPAGDVTANLGDPGHRWLTAVGTIEGNMSVMTIEIAAGGLFDTVGGVTRVEDGTITLEFKNCNEGTATYNIPSISAQGVVPIERVAKDNVSLCQALLQQLIQ